MKIIHVTSGMDPKAGGVSQAIRTMIKGLSNLGVNNEVVCMGNMPEQGLAEADNFTIHYVGPGKTGWQFNTKMLEWLKLNTTAYDIVLVHGLWLYHSYAVYRAFKNQGDETPKIFVMPHGMLDPWFQKAKGRKIKAIRNWIFWKLIENRIVHKADGLLFTCETEKLLARKTFSPYHPKSEKVVGLGVDVPPVATAKMEQAFLEKCPLGNRDKFLLFIGRIHEKKGVELLVRSYLALKSEGYGLPQLVIAGPGLETPYGQHIKKLAAKDKAIFFPGMLTGNAKWGAFYGSEAFILPSHQENFGIAVVEALACNKPVLITDQVNIWREIKSNHGGMIENDTLEGVKRLLKRWAKLSPVEKKNMSEKAGKVYTEYFSTSQAAIKLFEAVFQQHTPDNEYITPSPQKIKNIRLEV